MMKKSPRRRSSKKMQPVAVTPKQRSGPRRSWTRAGLRLIIWAALAWIGLSVLMVLPFRWLPPPTSSFMLQYYFEHGDMARRHWVPHRMIAPAMALAVVAAEDQKFPDHSGFDYQSIREAVADKLDGKPLRGASTISQQVAKNLYLWSGRSLARKGLEAWLTLWIEFLWPKQRILEVYLNIAEFGKGVYGVDAASQRFFRKPAATLSEYEAALLAAVLPNPVLYRADAPSAYVRERQRWILRQMRQLGGVGYIGGIWSQGP